MNLLKIFLPKKDGIILSRYSSLPRFFTIDGIKYDIDKPESINQLPMFTLTFEVCDRKYTMASLLREHAYEVKSVNYELYIAALKKAEEYTVYYEQSKPTSQEQTILPIEQTYHKKEFVKKETVDISEIDTMDGYQFEQWCAGLLEQLRFESIRRTGKSGDQGVDILAKKDGVTYAIQCKCYSSDLGNKPVQEVYAGKNFHGCHVGAVMTNRHFTPGGRSLASSTGVLLWDRDWIEKAFKSCHSSVTVKEDIPTYKDDMLPAAVDVILETRQASVSMLQRRLKLGYAHAARLIDEMEALGIVGPFQGSKPRDILITKHQWETMR